MVNAYEFTCLYGGYHTESTVYYYDSWYVVDGSINVNRTHDTVEDGTDIELLSDYDCFTWDNPIESLEDLINAVDD